MEHNHEHNHEHDESNGCRCGSNLEDLTLLLELGDETLECEIIGIFEAGGKEYVALSPVDSDEIIIYGYKESGDEGFELIDIDDEKEFESAAAVLDELLGEE
ncbi:MAG: DUF1292 domain-containing protein [Methanimicrococcus sp.]|nr:DUF1292 domain-containing protein [Methanimicrococcus sp.]